MIPVRRAHHELRRIARKNHLEGFSDGVGKIILLNPVPDVEEEAPAGFQDAARFGVAFDLVRKEHHAELAGHGVEAVVVEGECQGVRLSPVDLVIARKTRSRLGEHRFVQIGCRNPRISGKCDASALVSTPVPAAVSSKS